MIALLLAATLASAPSPSQPPSDWDGFSPKAASRRDAFIVGGTKGASASSAESTGSASRAGGAKAAAEDPDDDVVTCQELGQSSGRPDLCHYDVQTCAAAQASRGTGPFLQWVFAGKRGRPEEWRIVDTRCVGLGEVAAGVPAFTVREFRRLPLPAGKVNVEPGEGPVLINVATNVFVGAGPVVLRTRVVGVGVEVRATPSLFTWTFGDGGRLVTTDPGGAYPDMTTTHTYAEPGRWPVTLTTTYSGQYRVAGVPGSPWIPIVGTASVTSPSVTLDVIEARAVLVP